MSLGMGGGYCTCALALRARPIRNIKWRLQQDVNLRCFFLQQSISRCCHTSLPLPHMLSGLTIQQVINWRCRTLPPQWFFHLPKVMCTDFLS